MDSIVRLVLDMEKASGYYIPEASLENYLEFYYIIA